MNLRLAFQLGWGTLRSRLALTMLAVILISLGAAVAAGLWGTVYLLHGLQRDFLSALSVELDLVSDSDAMRDAVMSRADAWPSSEFVQYIPAEQTLHDVQKETGEDLVSLFGGNPFPPMVRVRFGRITLAQVDSLTEAARRWPEVSQVVYPRSLWQDVDRFIERFQGGLGLAAMGFILAAIGLVGLCLHAQVRNRAATWEFLRLSGASGSTLRLSVFVQGALAGALAGIAASALLYGLTAIYGWLFLREVSLPLSFYGMAWLAAVLSGLLAGIFSVRRV
ncbi:MAG TPA: permease-like cell division protein FtsX [bacterium]|jgi:cell division protein FtsX